MKSEPSVSIGVSISAVLYAIWAILRASGVEVTDDLRDGVEALVLALCAVPFVGGLVTRFFVISPQTAANAVVMAKRDTAPTPTVPAINVAGSAYSDAVKDLGFVPKPPPAN